jgi:hypothetical protein
MESRIITDNNRASVIAHLLRPQIYQEWSSIKDFLTGIVMGKEQSTLEILPSLIANPEVYYRTSEDNDYYYAFYMLFHSFDWSSFPIGFIADLDSHRFDTESILVRAKKAYFPVIQGDIATVSHKSIKFKGDIRKVTVFVEKEGHAIKPFEKRYLSTAKYTVYNEYKLESFDDMLWSQWRLFKRVLRLHGVGGPDELYDSRWLYSPFGIRHYREDMFNHPNKIFEKALETKRI